MYRFALKPAWFVGHVVCAVLVYVMIRLGLWQMGVSEHAHFNIRNFGYAIQWWLFAAFTPFMWVRIMRDHARRGSTPDRADAELRSLTAPPPTYRRYVPPPAAPASDDPTLREYNDYLARLADRDAREKPA